MSRLLVAFNYPDGGAAENVVQLAHGLGDHGWEIELVGPLRASVYDRIPASIRVHRLPLTAGYGTVRGHAAVLRGLRAVLRRGRFDLLHAHSAQPGLLTRLVRLTGGPPVVYTPHCFQFLAKKTRLRSMVALALELSLAPLTAAFIDVSEHERRAAIERHVGRAELHHLVRNGSGPCPDVVPDVQLVKFRQRGPLVVVISGLRTEKRVDVFLQALPQVFREVPNARAAVIGNGPESTSLRDLADELGLGAGGRLLMLPFQQPAARYLTCADLYVLSSAWESAPIGVLEAMACGVPQVATDVGGTSEAVVPDTGMIVPPSDPAALGRAIVDLLRDTERRRRMSQASPTRHAELFGLPRMVAETSAVYEAVLTGRSDGQRSSVSTGRPGGLANAEEAVTVSDERA